VSDVKQQPFSGAQYDTPEPAASSTPSVPSAADAENQGTPIVADFTDMWQQGNVSFNGKFKINGLLMQPLHRLAISGGVVTVDCTIANRFLLLVTQDVTIYLRAPLSDASFLVYVRQDSTGGHTVTWGINGAGQAIVKTISGAGMGSDTTADHVIVYHLDYISDWAMFVTTSIAFSAY